MKKIKIITFSIPVIVMLISVIASLINPTAFIEKLQLINGHLLSTFNTTFLIVGFIVFIIALSIYISPLGKTIIGGIDARPLLKKWQWFSITLCTTIATGLLFWTTAEPLYHVSSPPSSLVGENDLASFAISTMYLHWTFNPYSFYTVAALLFALGYYNHNRKFAVSTIFFPILKNNPSKAVATTVDTICLYSLLAGMTASLGAGILSISGGIEKLLKFDSNNVIWAMISIAIVGTFIISAISGLQKGIKRLSTINIYGFLMLLVFVLVSAPSVQAFKLGGQGFIQFIRDFIPNNLGIGIDKEWANDWTVFYWANWLAWTPITALFLGRLGLGYSVRMFIRMNLLYPSFFAIVWICIFSGNTLILNSRTNNFFTESLQANGPESAIYSLLNQLPAPAISSLLFIALAFLSYVTAADSNTSAMSALCTKGINPLQPEAPTWLKIIWGIFIGLMAWIMIAYAGIDGVRISSVLGGFPVLVLMLFMIWVSIKLILNSWYRN